MPHAYLTILVNYGKKSAINKLWQSRSSTMPHLHSDD
jgi:hypothetical protein